MLPCCYLQSPRANQYNLNPGQDNFIPNLNPTSSLHGNPGVNPISGALDLLLMNPSDQLTSNQTANMLSSNARQQLSMLNPNTSMSLSPGLHALQGPLGLSSGLEPSAGAVLGALNPSSSRELGFGDRVGLSADEFVMLQAAGILGGGLGKGGGNQQQQQLGRQSNFNPGSSLGGLIRGIPIAEDDPIAAAAGAFLRAPENPNASQAGALPPITPLNGVGSRAGGAGEGANGGGVPVEGAARDLYETLMNSSQQSAAHARAALAVAGAAAANSAAAAAASGQDGTAAAGAGCTASGDASDANICIAATAEANAAATAARISASIRQQALEWDVGIFSGGQLPMDSLNPRGGLGGMFNEYGGVQGLGPSSRPMSPALLFANSNVHETAVNHHQQQQQLGEITRAAATAAAAAGMAAAAKEKFARTVAGLGGLRGNTNSMTLSEALLEKLSGGGGTGVTSGTQVTSAAGDAGAAGAVGQGDLLSQVALHFQQQQQHQQQEAAVLASLTGQKRPFETADPAGVIGDPAVTSDSFLVTPPDHEQPAEKKQRLSVGWEDQVVATAAAAEPGNGVTGVTGVTRTATLGSSGTGAACSALLGLAANGTAAVTGVVGGGWTDSQADEQTGVLGNARAGSLRSGGSNDLDSAVGIEARATAAAAAADIAGQRQVAVAGSAGGQRLENFRCADGVTSDRAGDTGVPRNMSHLLLQSLESGDPLSRWGSAPTAGSTMALTLARYNSVEQQTTSQAQSEELLGGWE